MINIVLVLILVIGKTTGVGLLYKGMAKIAARRRINATLSQPPPQPPKSSPAPCILVVLVMPLFVKIIALVILTQTTGVGLLGVGRIAARRRMNATV